MISPAQGQYTDYIILPKILGDSGPYYALPDMLMSSDGDLQIDESGDIKVDKQGFESFHSDIAKRILTETQGLKTHLDYGARLDECFGFPVTQDLMEKIKANIYNSLIIDRRVQGADVTISPVRLDAYTIGVLVAIKTDLKRFVFPPLLINTNGNVTFAEG